jgi:hypothetical protein
MAAAAAAAADNNNNAMHYPLVIDMADLTHPLSTAEDLIHGNATPDLEHPVVFRVTGEDRVPFNVWDALTVLTTTKVGAFTRCALHIDDIEPLLLIDSRLPADSPVLARFHRNHVATMSILMCQYVKRGETMGARMLVHDGADINARGAADGGTALHMAVEGGHRIMASWLTDMAECDVVGICDDAGRSPFLKAVEVNDSMMVRTLLEVGARRGAEVRRRMVYSVDHDGESALTLAIRHSFTHMVLFLLSEGRAPVNAFDVSLAMGMSPAATPLSGRMSLSPVIVVIESNWPASILSTLVREGADLAAARKGGLGAMAVAAMCERVQHLRVLMRLGLTPDAEAFRQAAIANHPRILRYLAFPAWRTPLLLRQDGFDSSDEESFIPPPHKGGGHDGVRLPSTLRGSRALVAAVQNDAYQAAEALRDMGVRTTSALVEAVQNDRFWAVRLLIIPTALPPTWPDWHDTPLTLAVRLLRTNLVLFMAENGRLPLPLLNARRGGKDGRTALDLAQEGRLQNYVEVLRAAGGLTSAELSEQRRRGQGKRKSPGDGDIVVGDSGGSKDDGNDKEAEDNNDDVHLVESPTSGAFVPAI